MAARSAWPRSCCTASRASPDISDFDFSSDYDDEAPRPRRHLQVIAIVVALALVLPALFGTAVVIYRSLNDDTDDLPTAVVERANIAPFSSVRFRVGNEATLFCALLAATQAAKELGMQGREDLNTNTPGRASNVGLWVLQAVLAFQFAGGRHHEGCATWSACWRWPARSGC